MRGLSTQEVDDLLNGRGAGYARSADLNNNPGPRHVLDLQTELALSTAQVSDVTTIFEQMQAEARRLGAEIMAGESLLSTAFAAGTLSAGAMDTQVQALSQLYGDLRVTHLRAHLQTVAVLSPAQVAQYNTLRGYTATDASTPTAAPDADAH